MAVTVKTVKKKPLSLKKAPAPSDGAEGAEGQPADGAAGAAAAPAAAAGKKPAAPIKKASYTFAGICAILVFLMFSAILTLQILEWKFYAAPPKNAFPPFGIGPENIPIPGGGGGRPAPVADGTEDFEDFEDDSVPADDGGVPEEDGVPSDDGVPVE